AYNRIAYVFRTEVRILFWSRGHFGDDGVLEAGCLEGGLPAFDAFLDPFPPFHWCGGIDVIDDRLYWLGYRCVGILFLEPPTGDVTNTLRAMFIAAVIDHRLTEESDTLVQNARHHRFFRQFHHAVVQHNGGAAGTHSTRS